MLSDFDNIESLKMENVNIIQTNLTCLNVNIIILPFQEPNALIIRVFPHINYCIDGHK